MPLAVPDDDADAVAVGDDVAVDEAELEPVAEAVAVADPDDVAVGVSIHPHDSRFKIR